MFSGLSLFDIKNDKSESVNLTDEFLEVVEHLKKQHDFDTELKQNKKAGTIKKEWESK